jgi:hypothetical protein
MNADNFGDKVHLRLTDHLCKVNTKAPHGNGEGGELELKNYDDFDIPARISSKINYPTACRSAKMVPGLDWLHAGCDTYFLTSVPRYPP